MFVHVTRPLQHTSTSCGSFSALTTAKSISRCVTLHMEGKYCDNVTGLVCAYILGNLPLCQMDGEDGENISRNNKYRTVPTTNRGSSSQEKGSDFALVLWPKLRNFCRFEASRHRVESRAWQLRPDSTGGQTKRKAKK